MADRRNPISNSGTLLTTVVLTTALVLTGLNARALPAVGAAGGQTSGAYVPGDVALDADGQAAADAAVLTDLAIKLDLKELARRWNEGLPVTAEEELILRRFASGLPIASVEAEALLSRVLFIDDASGRLSTSEWGVLDRYRAYRAAFEREIRDAPVPPAGAGRPAERESPVVAPANDLCGGAEAIPGAGPFPYLTSVTADITDATETAGDPTPSCQANHSRSIWYSFTPVTSGSYTIQSCQGDGPTASTVVDNVMAVFSSAGGAPGRGPRWPATTTPA